MLTSWLLTRLCALAICWYGRLPFQIAECNPWHLYVVGVTVVSMNNIQSKPWLCNCFHRDFEVIEVVYSIPIIPYNAYLWCKNILDHHSIIIISCSSTKNSNSTVMSQHYSKDYEPEQMSKMSILCHTYGIVSIHFSICLKYIYTCSCTSNSTCVALIAKSVHPIE